MYLQFVGLHEWDVQCKCTYKSASQSLSIVLPGVGESQWAFKTTFEVSESDLSPSYADLVFDGLDTFATVHLVSSLITSHGPGILILSSS